jgi:hypothetical protein
LDWPLCIYDLYYKNDLNNYFVYRNLINFNIIDDYFFTKCHNDNISNKSNYDYEEPIKEDDVSEKEKRVQKMFIKSGFIFSKSDNCFSKNRIVFDQLENTLSSLEFRDTHYETNLIDHQKDQIYKELLIERRPHYCQFSNNINHDKFINLDQSDSDFISPKKLRISEIKDKKENLNKSFTALHPYFNEFVVENKAIHFSKCISKLRITLKDNNELMDTFYSKSLNETDLYNIDI